MGGKDEIVTFEKVGHTGSLEEEIENNLWSAVLWKDVLNERRVVTVRDSEQRWA